jgi:uncharacterized membrane protein (DUF4010 family)
MQNGSPLHRVESIAVALVGVLFFFAIVGVFGLRLAIAGLAVFVLGALVVYLAFPIEDAES